MDGMQMSTDSERRYAC